MTTLPNFDQITTSIITIHFLNIITFLQTLCIPTDSRNNMINEGRAKDQSNVGEIYVTITLLSVLLAGFYRDALGVPLFGPFLFGLVIPKDTSFPHIIIEKIEDIVTGIFLPLFFASSGLKTNLVVLHGASSMLFLLMFIATTLFGKIHATLVSARLLIGLPPRQTLILSFLMNTKGLGDLIVLNIGKDMKVNKAFCAKAQKLIYLTSIS